MVVEKGPFHTLPKPWDRTDVSPWTTFPDTRVPLVETWFERDDSTAPPTALRLKLILTTEPRSSPESPSTSVGRAVELPQSKDEAWAALSADADATIALGLKQHRNPAPVRARIHDGPISDQHDWQAARPGDCSLGVPEAVHPIWAGLVMGNIQRRTNTTCRLVGHASPRDLRSALTVGPRSVHRVGRRMSLRRLTSARSLLIANPHVVIEQFTLAAGVVRGLDAMAETRLVILAGAGRVNSIEVEAGIGVVLQGVQVHIDVGPQRLQCLVVYARSAPAPYLLQRSNQMRLPDPARASPHRPLRIVPAPTIHSGPAKGAL